MRMVMVLAVLLMSAPSFAETFRWEAPAAHENGYPITDPATELTEYRLYCDGGADPVATFPPEALAGQHAFRPGTQHTCHLTAVLSSDGSESRASASRTFTEAASRPLPPVLLGSTAPDFAYSASAPSGDSVHPNAPVGSQVEIIVVRGEDVRVRPNGSVSGGTAWAVQVRHNDGRGWSDWSEVECVI